MTLNPAGLEAHRDHQENCAERSSPLKPCKSHAAGATVPPSPRPRVQASFHRTVSWVSPAAQTSPPGLAPLSTRGLQLPVTGMPKAHRPHDMCP